MAKAATRWWRIALIVLLLPVILVCGAATVLLFVVNPGGLTNVSGATLNNPERTVVNNPVPGTWVAMVSGCQLPTNTDKFELRVSPDGKIVK